MTTPCGSHRMGWSRTILAPLLGELSAVRLTEGSPVLVYCQQAKDRTCPKNAGSRHCVFVPAVCVPYSLDHPENPMEIIYQLQNLQN